MFFSPSSHARTTMLSLGGVLAVVALTAGCGSDDAASGPPDTAGPGGERACQPVNSELADQADQVVQIGAKDFAYDQDEYTAEAGTMTFDMSNNGGEEHELAFLPGGGDVPFVDGEADEAALEAAGAFELEAFGPGQSCTATYTLAAGTYTLFCIVQTSDGETHYDKGMKSTLVVT